MRDGKADVAITTLLTMSGVTMTNEEKQPAPRRKLKPTGKEKVLLGKLSEQERKAQETYQQRLAELKAAHKARVGEATGHATGAVRGAKTVFDAEARKLTATKANAAARAEKVYCEGLNRLAVDKGAQAGEAERVLDDATLASARRHETEAAALTNGLNTALNAIFAERESIEYGDRLKKEKADG